MSCKSDSHHKEYNCYNRIAVDKLREDLKHKMKIICKKYRFNYKVMRVIVNFEFNLDLYCLVKVSILMYNYDFYKDWKYSINKQKKWGEVCIIPIYPPVF